MLDKFEPKWSKYPFDRNHMVLADSFGAQYGNNVVFTASNFWTHAIWCWSICFSLYLFQSFRHGVARIKIMKPTHNHLWIHVRKPYLYKYLRRLSQQILEIDDITMGASLSIGNVAYHWMHNAVKFQNIRSQEESNPEPQVLPRFL